MLGNVAEINIKLEINICNDPIYDFGNRRFYLKALIS